MMQTISIGKIENNETNIWGISLNEPMESEFELRELEAIKLLVATKILGSPVFEKKYSNYWYLIDKPTNELDDIDYMKECIIFYLINTKLTREAEHILKANGFIDSGNLHNSQDKELFERHIANFDEFDLTFNDVKIRTKILNIQYEKRNTALYKLKYTLALVRE